ncbi:hypothetical protein [Ramlibacter sp.]|uniref:hypothetical protein n=1 Tax=Ramlibacter sp. TaxID=1917967 RepID=UPI002FCBB098
MPQLRPRRIAPARIGAAALLVLASLVACTPRIQTPPPPATIPGPVTPPLDRPVPPAPLTPPPAVPEPKLADGERGPVLFAHWRTSNAAQVDRFEQFLAREDLAGVVPTYQLLRSASMWKECKADPFDVPPPALWPKVREVLVLLRELRRERVLSDFEVVSAYRAPVLNRCAGGAPGSSHQIFAVDIAPIAEAAGLRLCGFWREQGQQWDMGVSRYPSGRIHIDRNGFRTWGASHKRGSSYCLDTADR